MNWFRKNPLFATGLTLCSLLALGECALIYERFAASRAAEKKLLLKKTELQAMADLTPAPTREVATAIQDDLARAKRVLDAMQAELKGRGPAAERMRRTKAPAARTDAYFDLATFVEKTREFARKHEVDVRPEASRFGFRAYANEGPELDRIASVFHQRLVAQYIIEALIEAHPRAILAVQREHALSKSERETRDAAIAAAVASGAPVDLTADAAASGASEGPDFFVIDPRVSARAPGYIDTTAFRVTFVGQTSSLRAFLNRLAGFELPVLVREVEVDTASAEDTTPTPVQPDDSAAAEQIAAASVVLAADPPAPKAAPKKTVAKPPVTPPIVAKPFSKFIVTVEFLDFVPSPANPADPAPAGAGPTT